MTGYNANYVFKLDPKNLKTIVMKNLISVLLISLSFAAYGQSSQHDKTDTQKTTGVKDDIFRIVDRQAIPPGGFNAFGQYLSTHTVYPEIARKNGIKGKVTYQFVVDKKGRITNVTILKDIGAGCGDAVKNALEKYPAHWTPAKNNGHSVKCYFVGNFNFTLTN